MMTRPSLGISSPSARYTARMFASEYSTRSSAVVAEDPARPVHHALSKSNPKSQLYVVVPTMFGSRLRRVGHLNTAGGVNPRVLDTVAPRVNHVAPRSKMICPQNEPSAATIPEAIASGRSSTVPRYDRSTPTD